MKKNIKRLMALVVAMVMAVAMMSVSAFAANTPVDTSTHTFKAYEILKGTQASDSNELAVSGWGDGIDSTAFLNEVKTLTTADGKTPFADVTDAKSFATVLANYQDKSDVAKAIAKIADANTKGDGMAVESGKTELAAGYYLIKDTTVVTNKQDAANPSVLYLPKHAVVNIESKADVPTVEKNVYDTNDTLAKAIEDPASVPADKWEKSADYDVNDKIPYQITGTLPSNYDDYKTYSYTFTDTMSKGLTYNNDAKFYKVDSKGTKTELPANTFTVSSAAYSGTEESYNGGNVITAAAADLKTAGVAAGDKIVMEYTATLNSDAIVGVTGNPNKVDLTYSNNPNKGGEGETGKTPEDKNIVFTYDVEVSKVAAGKDKTPLEGAVFELYKEVMGEDGKLTLQQVNLTTSGNKFTASKVDDGKYVLVETKAPDGYNLMDGTVTVGDVTKEHAKEFEVTATHEGTTLTALNGTGGITLTAATDMSKLSADVVDEKGSTLPSTGGIGTTIFYVLGAILVAGAAIVLVARKRSQAE